MQLWGSSTWGERFTNSAPWRLTLRGSSIELACEGSKWSALVSEEPLQIKPGIFWAAVAFRSQHGHAIEVDGIPNAEAAQMAEALAGALADLRAQEQKRTRIESFQRMGAPLKSWFLSMAQDAARHAQERRWIAEETLQRWLDGQTSGHIDGEGLSALLRDADVRDYAEQEDKDVLKALEFWRIDLRLMARRSNERLLADEMTACADFFRRAEKSPLTPDQIRAVVCFDNRVLTIASAGSGKTSTMVAKAGYAMHRGFIKGERILLLAFNKDAADELQERVRERLGPMGFDADAVVARTFHAFGLDVIGRATGRKPSLAPWLDSGKDIAHLSDLIDGLKDSNPVFRAQWDLFRIVFSRDLPEFGKEEENTEDRDRKTNVNGFKTLKKDEVVKSQGERLIADWLFYNGVHYRYEQPYEHDTATSTHRQYTPDFYYPDIGLYHEHLALDHRGNPPPTFKDYLQGVEWKRDLHRGHGTELIETTSAQLRSGRAFAILTTELTKRGIVLDPNPDRPIEGRTPIAHEDLVRVFRTFLTHAKSNRLSDVELRARLNARPVGGFACRHAMFLDLFEAVRLAWENSLRSGGFIDFEDMLNLAADHLEQGRWESPFELVMVDEFQDASRARARLTRALVARPGRFLFAVGDDWQSINRFAGADIAVMTEFESWFGRGDTIRLEQTFRCPQSICDVSSQFIQKNPAQISKRVRSGQPEHGAPVEAFEVDSDEKLQDAIDKYLSNLYTRIERGEAAPPRKGKISVFVLGRYRKDQQYVPPDWDKKYGRHISLTFLTVHGSKGLEADYVILPRVVRGWYSFPSAIEDDPVLQLAMPSADAYPFGEERRLFYVALTRARRSIALFTVQQKVSPFAVELINDRRVELLGVDGKATKTRACPKCTKGTLVKRRGPYSEFLGCARFPRCDFREKLPVKSR